MRRLIVAALGLALLEACSGSMATLPVGDASPTPVTDGGSSLVDGTALDGTAPLQDGRAPTDATTLPQDATVPGNRLLVGYYADWTTPTFPVTAIDWSALTHVAHAFALPQSDGGLSNLQTFPNDALVAAAHAHGVKVVASVGGAKAAFDTSVVTAAERKATISALVSLCASHGYDGVDVDWEFPTSTTISAWVSLMDELRVALDAVRPGLSLSTTVDDNPANSAVYPVASLAKLDWVSAMTYAYTTAGDSTVGYYAPLSAPAGTRNVTDTIQQLVARGIPASKLLLGLGLYGVQFVDGPPGTPISSPSTVTTLTQAQLVPLLTQTGWKVSWDATASESSLLSGKTWITYEDARSIDAKCAFAHAQGLGGAMLWEMAQGVFPDGSQPLVTHAMGCR